MVFYLSRLGQLRSQNLNFAGSVTTLSGFSTILSSVVWQLTAQAQIYR